VNVLLVLAGVVCVTWPVQLRASRRRIRAKVAARGGDSARFDDKMSVGAIRALQAVVVVGGCAMIVMGLLKF